MIIEKNMRLQHYFEISNFSIEEIICINYWFKNREILKYGCFYMYNHNLKLTFPCWEKIILEQHKIASKRKREKKKKKKKGNR